MCLVFSCDIIFNMDMQEKIEQAFAKITTEKVEIFEQFRELLLEYNQKYNLTSILEKQDIYYKHFLDSAVGADFFKEKRVFGHFRRSFGRRYRYRSPSLPPPPRLYSVPAPNDCTCRDTAREQGRGHLFR